jgi:recombination protein RecA
MSTLLRDKINETVKAKIIRPLEEYPESYKFISSGIVDLDIKLGGGWPVGTIITIYGPQSSGKSLIAIISEAFAQRTCRHCYQPFSEKVPCECEKCDPCRVLHIDAENYIPTSVTWVKALGLRADTEILSPRYGEEAFDNLTIYMQERQAEFIVLDSVAALAPKVEIERSIEEQQQGVVPRLMAKFFRRWASTVADLRSSGRGLDKLPTVLFINQIREKIGVVYGNPEVMPGGRAQHFFSSAIVKATRKSIQMSSDEKDPQPLTQEVGYVVEKARMCPTKREGRFSVAVTNHIDEHGQIRMIGHIDNEKTLLEQAKRFHIFGEKSYSFDGRTFKTQEEILNALREDFAFRRTIFHAVNKAYHEYMPMAKPVKRKRDGNESEAGSEAKATS